MVKAINEKKGIEKPAKRIKLEIRNCQNMRIEDFVTKNTMNFFCRLGIPARFLNCDPELWPQRDDYKDAMKTVEHLRVVNDNAERGVALIEEYNSIITKNEDQKQYLLQVVQEHRRLFPTCKKDFFTASSLPGNS